MSTYEYKCLKNIILAIAHRKYCFCKYASYAIVNGKTAKILLRVRVYTVHSRLIFLLSVNNRL